MGSVGKNIWIFAHYAAPPRQPGLTRQADLASELVKEGYNVTIFSSAYDHRQLKYMNLSGKEKFKVTEEEGGYRFAWVWTRPYKKNNWRRAQNMVSYTLRSVIYSKKLNEIPDLVIGSSPDPFSALAGWLAAKLNRSFFAVEVRDLWPQGLVDRGALKKKGVIARCLFKLEKFLYKQSILVISPLSGMGDYLESKGENRNKFIWLPNGVDESLFSSPENLISNTELEQDLLKAEERSEFKAIYCGSHGPANCLENIVDAAAILNRGGYPIRFFMVGDGVSKGALLRRVETLNLENIKFYDPVPKKQVPSLLSRGDVLLHTIRRLAILRWGVSPNKLVEYMAASKPVITTISPDYSIVEKAGAGISIEAGKPEKLAEAIVYLYMNPHICKNMGKNGEKYIKQHFVMNRLSQVLINRLKSVF